MCSPLFAQAEQLGLSTRELMRQPLVWALLLGALALLGLLPGGNRVARGGGAVLGLISLGLLLASMPVSDTLLAHLVFWLLAAITLYAATATICARSPIYSAVWFAAALVGVSGLMMYQGSQFLGVATIAVYAGAIVVTFLFVVMLAQPEGLSTYDRISWGWFPKILSVASAAALLLLWTVVLARPIDAPRMRVVEAIDLLAASRPELAGTADQLATVRIDESDRLQIRLGRQVSAEQADLLRQQLPAALQQLDPPLLVDEQQVNVTVLAPDADVLDPDHMAHLGRQLFGRHLLSVELAGTLLLVALVGAIAIIIQGQAPADRTSRPATESTASQPNQPSIN